MDSPFKEIIFNFRWGLSQLSSWKKCTLFMVASETVNKQPSLSIYVFLPVPIHARSQIYVFLLFGLLPHW
jgi:hypothetical protein